MALCSLLCPKDTDALEWIGNYDSRNIIQETQNARGRGGVSGDMYHVLPEASGGAAVRYKKLD